MSTRANTRAEFSSFVRVAVIPAPIARPSSSTVTTLSAMAAANADPAAPADAAVAASEAENPPSSSADAVSPSAALANSAGSAEKVSTPMNESPRIHLRDHSESRIEHAR
ncbi:hypothetical protein RER_27920 [Rhodococcus erythropolis PR4]|uniref:Uncharacterized protein n=1 Tax=Rhodococcus erythropolis (strain PR4 / NBRC 100887) TaxID=234621 RepID=C0ZYR5_RHOE4|nr:hypothetical protein RER_27920 [Rhodococcus erythropolis PR4]